MCGIYGFSGKKLDKKIISILALQNMTRGMDSSGIYLENEQSYWHHKTVQTADELLKDMIIDHENKPFDQNINFLIGHNRAKTVGTVSKDNAHPFLLHKKNDARNINNIVLCHNGTLKDYYKLINHYDKITHADITVDSQLFATYFARYNEIDILKKFEGAAALLWKNVDESQMFAFRNAERPLHYGYVKGDMYISSEALPLQLVGANNIQEFEERKIYTIQSGKIVNVSEIIPHEPLVVVHTNRNYNNSHSVNNNEMKPILSKNHLKKLVKKLSKKGATIPLYLFNLPASEIKYNVHNSNETVTFLNEGDSITIQLSSFYDIDFSTAVKRTEISSNYKTGLPCYSMYLKDNTSFDFRVNPSDFQKELEEMDEASDDDHIPSCSTCDTNSNNIVCTCHNNASIRKKLVKIVGNINIFRTEEDKNKLSCDVCGGTGWDDTIHNMCYACDGDGFKKQNEELLTEEQMEELEACHELLNELLTKNRDILSVEEKDKIKQRIDKISNVLIEQQSINT